MRVGGNLSSLLENSTVSEHNDRDSSIWFLHDKNGFCSFVLSRFGKINAISFFLNPRIPPTPLWWWVLMRVNKLSLEYRSGSRQALFLNSSRQGYELNNILYLNPGEMILLDSENDRDSLHAGTGIKSFWLCLPWGLTKHFHKLWETIADRKISSKISIIEPFISCSIGKC